MNKDVAISVKNVTMSFNLNKEKVDNLKEYAIKLLTHKLEYKKFDALKNISFEVKKGERLAILGFNGAGKSTLLKAIVGVYKPTKGKVERNGVIAPLLELGAGFDPNYSGKENIFLYGAVLGYSREYIQSKYDEIVKFSELEKFINVPIKNYSSGMKARLGFSIATAVNPDVLILDEVLSVGDAKFREKSLKRVQEMFDRGVTVLFVSHSIPQVKKICDRAILLNHGEIIAQGTANDVAALYEKMTKLDKSNSALIQKEIEAFRISQRKKELEKEAKRTSYEQGKESLRAASMFSRFSYQKSFEQRRPSPVAETKFTTSIPRRESPANIKASTQFEDVYSSSPNYAPKAKPASVQPEPGQPASAGNNIQSSSSYPESSASQASISKAELEDIIRSFSNRK